MRLLLFAGFLGSGKTTLILALANQAALRDARVCVIVNEVGEVGIDGEVLRMGDLQVKEITAGCICCQIGVDLIRTLRELEELFLPDLVIIEASGIATPAGVLDALERYPVETVTSVETVTVVDPVRFEALYEVLTPLIESQIAGADTVVLTKSDLATPEEMDRAVQTVTALRRPPPRSPSTQPGRRAWPRSWLPWTSDLEWGEPHPALGSGPPGAVRSPGDAAARGAGARYAVVRHKTGGGSGCLVRRLRSFHHRPHQVSASHPGRRAHLQSHVGAPGCLCGAIA
jgi:Ni2+-binding GTPase involved in maturation of urease and hydrogenase